VFTDNKTALPVFKNLRVNSSGGDLLQRALLTKLLSTTVLILSEEYISTRFTFSVVAEVDNPADKLTRHPFAEKVIKVVQKLKTQQKIENESTKRTSTAKHQIHLFDFRTYKYGATRSLRSKIP
jgi:hypothetical protein